MKPLARLFFLAAFAASLPACTSDDAPTPETTRAALERLAPSRAGSVETDSPTTPPAAYRMTLQRFIKSSLPDGDGRLKPTRVVRTVRRPFVASVRDGLSRRLGFDQDGPTSVERAVFLRPLADEGRPDVYPPEASRRTGRTRRLAGRTCEIYRYDADEYCVDGAGLVLALRQGTTVEVASKVDVLGDPPPSAEATAATLKDGVSDRDRGSVRPVDPASSPPGRTDWALPAPPEGFTFVGRYAAVPLTRELLTEGSKGIVAGVTDVYVRGIDTIVVDRGGKLDTTVVTDNELGALGDPRDVNLGALGAGRSGIGGVGPFGYREVRAFPEKGRFVVVAGTLPVDRLVEIARALRPSPGTTLRYLDKL